MSIIVASSMNIVFMLCGFVLNDSTVYICIFFLSLSRALHLIDMALAVVIVRITSSVVTCYSI